MRIRTHQRNRNAGILSTFAIATFLMSVASCSSQQQQDEGPAVSEEDGAAEVGANQGDLTAANGGEGVNNASGDSLDGASDVPANSAPVANSTQELINDQTPPNVNEPVAMENQAAVNAATNDSLEAPINAPLNAPINAPANLPANAAPVAAGNTPPPANAAAPAADLAAVTPETAPAPAAAIPALTATEGSRVKYAKRKLVKRSQPGGVGDVVGELDRGDHPLVIKESDWSQLSNGTFVENEGLSEQGVGRAASRNDWR